MSLKDEPNRKLPIDLSDAYAVETPEDSRRLYAAWADSYNETFIKANSYAYPRRVAELFAKNISTSGYTDVIDIGCGTGAVGSFLASLRPDSIIDGFDISPEMLAQAAQTRRIDNTPVYRNLQEVDLTSALPNKTYSAMTSAGTFTHGHLGPETLLRLINLVNVGGWFVIGINAEHFKTRGFAETINRAMLSGVISKPEVHVVDVYEPGSPHFGDKANICIYQRKK
jgi:predicted TPR repeat methyltransferase